MVLSGAKAPSPVIVPIELCTVIEGQLYKKKLPNHLTADAVRFSTLKPGDRLDRIVRNGQSPVRGINLIQTTTYH